MHLLIGADCNARVGIASDDDDHHTTGQYGINDTNARGQWLKNWAAAQRLTIVNTFFKKQPYKYTTFTGPNKIHRQIDYLLANKRFWTTVKDCESTMAIDLGSDHKAVRLRSDALKPTNKRLQQPTKSKRQANTTCKWPPINIEQYQSTLTRPTTIVLSVR